MSSSEQPPRAYLVQGADPSLLSQELSALLARLLEGSGGLTPVEEYGEPAKSDNRSEEVSALGPALEACRTLPFLADQRIVVLRDASTVDALGVKELISYLESPLETTVLVLVHPGGAAPAALAKAVRAVGTVVNVVPAPMARARTEWFAEHLANAPVRLTKPAIKHLEEHLGEDLARLEGILGALYASYGPGASLGPDDIAPFLGAAGGVAPWDLTDAIDRGEAEAALSALHRMLEAGERHALQILATLHRHYGAMLSLDGSGAADENAAAEIAGMKPYPAKKALAQARRLGHDRIARAIALLAGADLDLRGRVAWPDDAVLEVLVARLARLVRERPGAGRASAAMGPQR